MTIFTAFRVLVLVGNLQASGVGFTLCTLETRGIVSEAPPVADEAR